MLIVLLANLSFGEHELHSGNRTYGGGHRIYQCRPTDTDYLSNCMSHNVYSTNSNTPFIRIDRDGEQS
jgi:hypothetical protein